MAIPEVTASLNKSVYSTGEEMMLTINYSDADTKPVSVTITVTDSSGNQSKPITVSAVIDALTVNITDNSGRVWTNVSDTGSVAVYKAVA